MTTYDEDKPLVDEIRLKADFFTKEEKKESYALFNCESKFNTFTFSILFIITI